MAKKTCIQCGNEFEITKEEEQFYEEKNLSVPKRCKECRKKNKKIDYKKKNSGYNKKDKPDDKQKSGVDNSNNTKEGSSVLSKANQKNNVLEKKVSSNNTSRNTNVDINTLSNDKTKKNVNSSSTYNNEKQNETASSKQSISKLESKKSISNMVSRVYNRKAVLSSIVAIIIVIAGFFGIKITDKNINLSNYKADNTVKVTQAPTSDVQQDTDKLNKSDVEDADKTDKTEKEDSTSANDTSDKKTYKFRNEKYLNEHFQKHGGEFDYKTTQEYVEGANRVINSKDALIKTEKEDGDYVYYLEDTNEFVTLSLDGYIRTYFKPDKGKKYFDKQ